MKQNGEWRLGQWLLVLAVASYRPVVLPLAYLSKWRQKNREKHLLAKFAAMDRWLAPAQVLDQVRERQGCLVAERKNTSCPFLVWWHPGDLERVLLDVQSLPAPQRNEFQMTDESVLARLFPEVDLETAELECPVPFVLMCGRLVVRVFRRRTGE